MRNESFWENRMNKIKKNLHRKKAIKIIMNFHLSFSAFSPFQFIYFKHEVSDGNECWWNCDNDIEIKVAHDKMNWKCWRNLFWKCLIYCLMLDAEDFCFLALKLLDTFIPAILSDQ